METRRKIGALNFFVFGLPTASLRGRVEFFILLRETKEVGRLLNASSFSTGRFIVTFHMSGWHYEDRHDHGLGCGRQSTLYSSTRARNQVTGQFLSTDLAFVVAAR